MNLTLVCVCICKGLNRQLQCKLMLILRPHVAVALEFFYFFYLSHTIIWSITSSERCSLHLTHPSAHTHLEQWAADAAAPGEQLGVRCLSRGQFLPEPRFEPTTSGYKSDALSIRPWLPQDAVRGRWLS